MRAEHKREEEQQARAALERLVGLRDRASRLVGVQVDTINWHEVGYGVFSTETVEMSTALLEALLNAGERKAGSP